MENKKVSFIRYIPVICGNILITSKCGQFIEVDRKKVHVFRNNDTNRLFTDDNVKRAKRKRNAILRKFIDFYTPLLASKKITIFCYVINARKYPNRTQKIHSLKKSLFRKGYPAIYHFAITDIGSDRIPHYHIFIVTDRIPNQTINKMLKKKKKRAVNFTLMNNSMGLAKYLMKKELFHFKKGRPYSHSRYFRYPFHQ